MRNKDKELFKELIRILSMYAGERGDNEGAIEVLERVLRERNILLRDFINQKLK